MTAILGVAAAFYPSASVTISDQNLHSTDAAPVSAVYTIQNDGTVRDVNSTNLETWLRTGSVSDCEVRATLVSGTTPTSGSALSSWLNCGTTRFWALTKSSGPSGSSVTCTLTIEIRAASSGTVLDSATVILTAEIA